MSYGTPGPYGGAPNPYGGPGYDQGYGQRPSYAYAGWGARVLARLVDTLFYAIPVAVIVVGVVIAISGLDTYDDRYGNTHTTGDANIAGVLVALVGVLAYFVLVIYNEFVRQGKRGETFGKTALGIRLVRESDGQPIGGGLAFVRYLAHFLDGLCYIGYLWPLWDEKKQTFADKVMSTVVVRA